MNTNDYIVSYYQFVLFTVSDDDGDITLLTQYITLEKIVVSDLQFDVLLVTVMAVIHHY